MTDFQLHNVESAPEASKASLEASQKAYGVVPNLHAAMAESPALLEAYKTIGGIFGKTELSMTEQQIVAMTNNRLNGCTYCMAAHTTIMQGAKVPEDVITSLREGTQIADPKLEALRQFAEKVNLKRGHLDDGDIEALIDAGYTKQTVLEVILGTAFKVLSNYTNHVVQTPLDDMFAKNEWAGESQPAS
ncbi:carboxymuconolactone decarboxylase family protein [Mariniblastus fucicola]|uniref:Carboxymuconolactone decarboxylase family protein n=1 Tax=Mariniblastus fucicola TaxID=980251 RepID=A0A5B9PAU0_9BACT|nr:carboxymuconolactone decarboxylase family protein [Mariniblastus fucicola]QEG21626.1 Carboxymuconolactone decarboxylase family protein [Mariniblastus fucicola]